MPILRKIMEIGRTKVISIPRSWLEIHEKEAGMRITHVQMEVGRDLRIEPYLPKDTLPKDTRADEKREGGR